MKALHPRGDVANFSAQRKKPFLKNP